MLLTLYGKQHVMVLLLLLQKNIKLDLDCVLLNISYHHNNNTTKNILLQIEAHLAYELPTIKVS